MLKNLHFITILLVALQFLGYILLSNYILPHFIKMIIDLFWIVDFILAYLWSHFCQ